MRACVSMSRNERSEPRDRSNRSGCSQSRRNTSCTISSAVPRSQSIALAQPEHRARVAPIRLRERVRDVARDGDDEPDVVGVRVRDSLRHALVRHRPDSWMRRMTIAVIHGATGAELTSDGSRFASQAAHMGAGAHRARAWP